MNGITIFTTIGEWGVRVFETGGEGAVSLRGGQTLDLLLGEEKKISKTDPKR